VELIVYFVLTVNNYNKRGEVYMCEIHLDTEM